MELNSLLILLEAAEYLERRDREAEHGYASVLPYNSDFSRKKTKATPISRKAQSNRSSHNELEKHRRAKLRLYLEQLKQLVPLGPDSTRHTTLSLLKRARMHIKKLEEQDRKALNVKEQLQREHRYLKRRLEQLGMERIRTDSMGSTISTDSEQEVDVDIEGMEFTPVWDRTLSSRMTTLAPTEREWDAIPQQCVTRLVTSMRTSSADRDEHCIYFWDNEHTHSSHLVVSLDHCNGAHQEKNESAYREEMRQLVNWFEISLSLKTKEMRRKHSSIYISCGRLKKDIMSAEPPALSTAHPTPLTDTLPPCHLVLGSAP
ncbi:hypothetical protein AOLI_G00018670 [Acnodon oligacanthus]